MKNFNEKVIAALAAFVVALTIFVFVLSDAVCDMIKAFRVEKKVELVVKSVPTLEEPEVEEEPEELPLVEEEPEIEEDTPEYDLTITDFLLECKKTGYIVQSSQLISITKQMQDVGIKQAVAIVIVSEGEHHSFKIVEFKEGIDAHEGAKKLVDLSPETADSASWSCYHKNLAMGRKGTEFLLPIFESL